MPRLRTTCPRSRLLAITACLVLNAHAGVIQSFSDQTNIPNYTSGTTLGTFSVTATPDLYVGYTLDWNSGTIGSNKFVVLYFGGISAGVNFGLKSDQGPGGSDFVIRYGSSSPVDYSDYQVTVPDSVRVVGRIQDTNNSGDYDAAALWINPTTADLGLPDATISGFSMTISPSPLGLRSVNLSGDDIDLTGIVVANDFASAVPEPSTFGLLAFAGVGLLLRRSRHPAA